MKLKTFFVIGIILMMSIPLAVVAGNTHRMSESRSPSGMLEMTQHIIPQETNTLSIHGDAELAAAKDSGSGTSSDPYIIENRNYTSSGVTLGIEDTTKHVIIRNSAFTTSDPNQKAVTLATENVKFVNVTMDQRGLTGEVPAAQVLSIGNSANITLVDCEIRGGRYGIYVASSSNITIQDSLISDHETYGISFVDHSYGDNITIKNSIIRDNHYGVTIFDRTNINIVDSEFINNTYGLSFVTSQNITIENNVFRDHTSPSGMAISYASTDNMKIHNNNFENNHRALVGSAVSGQLSDNVTISQNQFIDMVHYAMTPDYLNNSEIIGNSIDNASYGMVFSHSEHLVISGNTLSEITTTGIYLDGASSTFVHDVEIVDNWIRMAENVNNNNIQAIRVEYGEDLRIAENTINDTYIGINLQENRGVSISDNVITHASLIAINIQRITLGTGLLVENNVFGFSTTGLSLAGNNHLIRNNDFILNRVSDSYEYESQIGVAASTINNTFVNNFFDEWTGPDADADGIVDDPYIVKKEYNGADPDFIYDTEPMAEPNNEFSFSFLGRPRIITPYQSGGDTFTTPLSIDWTDAYHSDEASITYDLEYWEFDTSIIDIGDRVWMPLASELTETEFTWDAADVNGAYIFRVNATSSDGLTSSELTDNSVSVTSANILSSTSSDSTTTTETTQGNEPDNEDTVDVGVGYSYYWVIIPFVFIPITRLQRKNRRYTA